MVFPESYHAIVELPIALVHHHPVDICCSHAAVADFNSELERLAHLGLHKRRYAEVAQQCHSAAQPLVGAQARITVLLQIDLQHIVVVPVLCRKADACRLFCHPHLHLDIVAHAIVQFRMLPVVERATHGIGFYEEEAICREKRRIQFRPAILVP